MANRVSVEVSANVQGFQQGMQAASQSAQQYETDMRKVSDSTVNFNQELRKAKREAQNLAAGYAKLDAAAKQSAFGQEMKRQLDAAKQAAADYIDLQGDLQQELRNMASDTKGLDTLAEGIGVIGDVTSTALGIVAQFTGNEEDAQRAVVAFTTAQSAANSAIKIANALQPYSNTMKKIGTLQDMAAAAATKLKTSAEEKNIVTTKAAAAAQALFNKIAAMNPYVLLAMAIVGVATALGTFIALTHKSADEEEAEQRIAEKSEKVHKAYYDTLNSSLEETVPKYIKLQEEWKNLRSEGEKLQWIKDNQSEFENLGIQINTVEDAENALISNSAAVMESFMKRAKAAAMAAQATEIYKQALEDVQWLEEHKNDNTITDDELKSHGLNRQAAGAKRHHGGGALGLGRDRLTIDADKAKVQRMAEANKKIRQLYKEMAATTKQGEEDLANAGVKGIKKGNKKKNAARKSGAKETKKIIHENSLEQAEEEVKTWEQALKQADVNDTELINKIKENLNKAKENVQGIKVKLGLDVDVKTNKEMLDKVEKDLKSQLDDLKADAVIALSKQDYETLDQISNKYDEVNKKLKDYNSLKASVDLQLDGVEVNSNMSGAKDALSGNFNKSIQGYQDAISALESRMKEIDWSSLEPDDRTDIWDKYTEKIKEYKDALEGLSIQMSESTTSSVDDFINKLDKQAEKLDIAASVASSTSSAFSSLGQAFSAAGDESTAAAIQVVGSIADMVAQVIPQIISLIGAKQAEAMASGVAGAAAMPFPASIAAIASIVATVVSTFASILSAVGAFADGGVVGGNSYTGDKLFARVNSGEMILNQRQQRNLNNMLDTNAMPKAGGTNVTVQGVIKGTDLMLVQRNTSKIMAKAGNSIKF